MSNFDPGPWRRLSPILDAALELRPEQRAAYLDAACAGDSRLRAAAESLLAAADQATGFLDQPAPVPADLFGGRPPEGAAVPRAARAPDTAALPPASGLAR